MANIKIYIEFKNFQAIDEKSSDKVRQIIEKQRKHAIVKKTGEDKGVNEIGSGEKVPDLLAGIDFRISATDKETMSEVLSQILEEITELGYEFTYEFSKVSITFDDGGIDEKTFQEVISNKRTLGYGKQINPGFKMTDINTKNIIMPIFSLECDKKDFIGLLFEIMDDFKKLGYSFEVRGY